MSRFAAAATPVFRRLPATLFMTVRAWANAVPRIAALFLPPTATALVLAAICTAFTPLHAQSPGSTAVDEGLLAALQLRGIGPAFMSGRIADVAVDPTNRSVWYVATSSSNVWKTVNRGTTWTPIFDDYPSYSTGSIAIDPTDSNVVWLGTGENTSQRSVGWGDGVYKSLDGGRTWSNTGLRTSEHIGQILIDPRDPDVVYAAAMGGLWAPGGDRGLFKTTDGGATWTPVLEISENTGIADVAMDPRDPDVLYAVAFQRRRHVGVLIAGGPESGVWKSTDGGETWRDITQGLPAGDLGRIALAVSPIDPDVLYANAAATEDRSGFYRSPDRGETWVRMSDYIVVDPQYYGELYPDPHRMDRVYAVDVFIHVTNDGGRTFDRVNTRFKHVDNHEIVFDPDDPDYMLVGSDGGLYETFDGTRTWRYASGNMPLFQFYRVGIDNMSPFYTVYGGTQDNSSVGGPSRTDNVHGIRNSDWFITHGGDGFQARVDPDDPNIVYTQSQYAGIVRYDRASGEELDIQPQPEAGEGALRWHWDSPLIISPHNPRRIYFAAQKLFRSDDRAETWTAVSGDLSRGLDRNQRPVMGRIWPPEAVWKNVFTSPYGTIVALDESPLVEGLLYVGTDDGLVQVSEDGGGSWRRQGAFPAVPAMAYVADVVASRHMGDRVYAVFNNHKEGDFAPYVVRSDDRGATWTNITGDVPDGQSTWTLMEDHVDPDLLFLGTEFGLFVTRDGGGSWVRLRGGLPTIAVRDLEIQRREDDLVLATFGRGFYILDDYSPLREMDEAVAGPAHLFPVKDPWAYIPARPLGGQEKGTFGDAFFTAPNPPFGAVFTFYLGDSYESLKERRQRLERAALARGEDIEYPDQATLTAEDMERPPEVFVVVSDAAGDVVRRVPAPRRAGLHRIAWDLRYASLEPPSPDGGEADGPMVAPGEFAARLVLVTAGGHEDLTAPQSFTVKPLGTATVAAADRDALLAFQREVAELQRAAIATDRAARATSERLDLLRRAVRAAPGLDAAPYEARITAFEARLFDIGRVLSRDRTALDRAEFAPPSVMQRISRVVGAQFRATSAPTTTHRDSYAVASAQLGEMSAALRTLVEGDIAALEAELEAAGVPWTPGRPIPRWPR